MNNVRKIRELGQSIWLDFFDRRMMDNGDLKKMIDTDGASGVTSNPAIFEKAVAGSSDYDEDIRKWAQKREDSGDVFFGLAAEEIRRAAGFFKPRYDETGGRDGFVSLEVSPYLAYDTEGTIRQAEELWKSIDRENAMIKIPATKEGLPAIRHCLREGININITLLFGLPRYREVIEAFLGALEDRVKNDQPIDKIASVASFFLSRIDVLTDPILEEKGEPRWKGEVAIASAKEAYRIYKEIFSSDRWKALEAKGAHPQRLLWASTGTKDPAYSDVKYVEALIGPETVNTIPLATLEAFRDHGKPQARLEENPNEARTVLEGIKKAGIDIDQITEQLEKEGVEKFNNAYDKLIGAIEQQISR